MKTYEEMRRLRACKLANLKPVEIALAERLRAAGIDFEQQCIIGYCMVDFCFPKKMLIIEIGGEPKNPKSRRSQRRAHYPKRLGFKVVRVPFKKAGTFNIRWIKNRRDRADEEFNRAIGKARAAKEEKEAVEQWRAEVEQLRPYLSALAEPRLIKRG